MEKDELTVDKFLSSLSIIIWRIKWNNQWYELRVANDICDKPFVDKEGVLFGVKNAKINYYVFKADTNEVADWLPSILKDIYTECKYYELPDDEVNVSWHCPYALDFIQNLLNKKGFLIFTRYGVKEKKWDPDTIF